MLLYRRTSQRPDHARRRLSPTSGGVGLGLAGFEIHALPIPSHGVGRRGPVLRSERTEGARRPRRFAGETVPGRPLLILDEASSTCIDLPWGAELGTISDTKLSELCVVTELGQLETTGERARWWAIYRRESVWGAESDRPVQDLDLFPDTIEPALLRGRRSARIR